MNKLDKAASMSDLLKAGATVEQCQLTAAVFDVLNDLVERLTRIEKADLVREATKSFVFEAPINGSAVRGLSGISTAEVEAKFAALTDGLHIVDKGKGT
jgi:phosphoglucomutase